jgi:hypothetical protein
MAALPSTFIPYWLRQQIKSWPGVLATQLTLLRPGSAQQLARASTLLCVEGFPRSGNGFALTCVGEALDIPQSRIAHHTHSIANVRRAVGLGLPTYVLVREPGDCCASLVIWGASRTMDDGLKAYEAYHRALLALGPRVTIVPFEQLTADPEGFLRQVAADLGRPAPAWNEAVAALVQRAIERSDQRRSVAGHLRTSLPTEAKARLKARMDTAPASPRLARCRALRAQVLAGVTGQGAHATRDGSRPADAASP